MFGRTWFLTATLVAMVIFAVSCGKGGSSNGDVTCAQAYRHRADLMKARSPDQASVIDAARRNEVELCESSQPPQAVLRCYLTITAADLDQNMFAFEEKCDKLGATPTP